MEGLGFGAQGSKPNVCVVVLRPSAMSFTGILRTRRAVSKHKETHNMWSWIGELGI